MNFTSPAAITFFMYKDGKRFSDLQKRGKRERGEKGGRKQVAVTLLRKWALVSVKSEGSKALSKALSGQVRAVPPAGVATLEVGTGGGDLQLTLSSERSAECSALLETRPHLQPSESSLNSCRMIPAKWELDQLDFVKIIGPFLFLLKKEFINSWYFMLYITLLCVVTTTMLCSQGAKWEVKLNMEIIFILYIFFWS